MKGKQSHPYLGFLKEYAFRKKAATFLHFNDSDNCVNSGGFFGASGTAGKSDR